MTKMMKSGLFLLIGTAYVTVFCCPCYIINHKRCQNQNIPNQFQHRHALTCKDYAHHTGGQRIHHRKYCCGFCRKIFLSHWLKRKSKAAHSNTRNSSISHCFPVCGTPKLPVNSDAIRHSTPITPSCSIPTVTGSAFCVTRSVAIMHAA